MHQLFKLRDGDLSYPRPGTVEVYRFVVVAGGSADRQSRTSHSTANLDTNVVELVHRIGTRRIEGEDIEAPQFFNTPIDVSIEIFRPIQYQASCVRGDHLQRPFASGARRGSRGN